MAVRGMRKWFNGPETGKPRHPAILSPRVSVR
jgi:hypothetical protein